MTKCPHCNKKLFHTKTDDSFWSKGRGWFDKYLFECFCISHRTLYENKVSGFSKAVDAEGNIIYVMLYIPEQFEIASFYTTVSAVVNYEREPGTDLYGLVTNEKSKSKYKVKTLITKISEIKDLTGEIDIPKLRAWAETLAIFS